jgi:hypothetical protein
MKFIHIDEKAEPKSCLGNSECMKHCSKLRNILPEAFTSIVSTTGTIAGSITTELLNGHSAKSRNFNYFSISVFLQRNLSVP